MVTKLPELPEPTPCMGCGRVIAFVLFLLALASEHSKAQGLQDFKLNRLRNDVQIQEQRAASDRMRNRMNEHLRRSADADQIEITDDLVLEQKKTNVLTGRLVEEQKKANALTAGLVGEQKRANDLKERELGLLQTRTQREVQAADLAKKQAQPQNPVPIEAATPAMLIAEQKKANAIKEQQLKELTIFLGIATLAVVALAVGIGGAVSFQIRKARTA